MWKSDVARTVRIPSKRQSAPPLRPSDGESGRITRSRDRSVDSKPRDNRLRKPSVQDAGDVAPPMEAYVIGLLRRCEEPEDVLAVWEEEREHFDVVNYAAASHKMTQLYEKRAPWKRRALPKAAVAAFLGGLRERVLTAPYIPSTRTSALLVWSLGKLGAADEEVVAKLASAAAAQPESLRHGEIAQLLHGLSRLGFRHDALVNASADRVAARPDLFSEVELTGIASSLVALGVRGHDVFGIIASEIVRRSSLASSSSHHFSKKSSSSTILAVSPRCLASTLHALAKSDCSSHESWDPLVKEVTKVCNRLEPPSLSAAAWALDAAGKHDPDALASIARYARHRQRRIASSPQQLATVVRSICGALDAAARVGGMEAVLAADKRLGAKYTLVALTKASLRHIDPAAFYASETLPKGIKKIGNAGELAGQSDVVREAPTPVDVSSARKAAEANNEPFRGVASTISQESQSGPFVTFPILPVNATDCAMLLQGILWARLLGAPNHDTDETAKKICQRLALPSVSSEARLPAVVLALETIPLISPSPELAFDAIAQLCTQLKPPPLRRASAPLLARLITARLSLSTSYSSYFSPPSICPTSPVSLLRNRLHITPRTPHQLPAFPPTDQLLQTALPLVLQRASELPAPQAAALFAAIATTNPQLQSPKLSPTLLPPHIDSFSGAALADASIALINDPNLTLLLKDAIKRLSKKKLSIEHASIILLSAKCSNIDIPLELASSLETKSASPLAKVRLFLCGLLPEAELPQPPKSFQDHAARFNCSYHVAYDAFISESKSVLLGIPPFKSPTDKLRSTILDSADFLDAALPDDAFRTELGRLLSKPPTTKKHKKTP